jgi:hypothetical protein
MLKFIESHGLEGAVAKRSDSVYQPGQRTGPWSKYRVNLDQEFVIGGYIPSSLGVDSLVVWLLSREGSDLCGTREGRPGACYATRGLRATEESEGAQVPFRQPPRVNRGPMGSGAHRGEDEGMCLGAPGASRPHPVSGVDRGRSHERHKVRCAQRRQRSFEGG